MHRMVLLSTLVFGCSNNALPTENNGGGTSAGTTTAGTTTAGSTGTNGGTTGGTTTGGPPGALCKTACDCMTGLACFQNMCQPTQMFQLYCCGSGDCPSGQVCQGADGSFGTCGGGTTGGGSCKTACDCPSGEACFNGGCIMPPMGPLYCCDSCPTSGGFCQAMDGSFGQCGGGTTTGSTTGGTTCNAIMCMSDADCMANGCTNGCSMRRHVCR